MAFYGKFQRINIAVPSPYDDSLSFLEYLGLLHTKINELITLVNSYETEYMGYTDEQINLLREETDAKFVNVYQTISSTDTSLRSLISSTDTSIRNTILSQYNLIKSEYTNLINSVLNTLNARITSEIAVVNSRITMEINALENYIDSGFINVQVIDVVTGQPSTIQEALNSLADQFKASALTNDQFDLLDLTCTAFDLLNITAFEFDFNGISL